MPIANKSDQYTMSLRVKANVGRTLEKVAEQQGLNKTSVLILALWEFAKKHGVACDWRFESCEPPIDVAE